MAAMPGGPQQAALSFLKTLALRGAKPAWDAFWEKYDELKSKEQAPTLHAQDSRNLEAPVGDLPGATIDLDRAATYGPRQVAASVPVYAEQPAMPPTRVTSREHAEVERFLGLDENALEARRGKTVVSLGEGFSNYARNLQDSYGCRAIAVDLIHAMDPKDWASIPAVRPYLKEVTPEWAETRFPRERYAWDVEKLDLPDGSVDFVDASFLFSHFESPEAAIAEAMRVLRPGGELRFNYWYRENNAREMFENVKGLERLEAWLPKTFPDAQVTKLTHHTDGSERNLGSDGVVFVVKKPE